MTRRTVSPGYRNSQGGTVRRDKRGRRIGYNWWREYNMECFDAALRAVESHREDNHQMEPDEYSAAFPKPQYKHFLIANKGMGYYREEPA